MTSGNWVAKGMCVRVCVCTPDFLQDFFPLWGQWLCLSAVCLGMD